MAVTNTPAFAQTPRLATAVCTSANSVLTDSPNGTAALLTAGANGAVVTRLHAVPRASIAADGVAYLYESSDGGTTRTLIRQVAVPAATVSATVAGPEIDLGVSPSAPLYLAAGQLLYAGFSQALGDGMAFVATYLDL